MSANILWGNLHHYKKPSMHERPSRPRTCQITAIRQIIVNPYGLKTILYITEYAHISMHIHMHTRMHTRMIGAYSHA